VSWCYLGVTSVKRALVFAGIYGSLLGHAMREKGHYLNDLRVHWPDIIEFSVPHLVGSTPVAPTRKRRLGQPRRRFLRLQGLCC